MERLKMGNLSSYEGYGIDTSSIKWKNDSHKTLMDLYLKDEANKSTYVDYCYNNGLTPDDEASMEDFVENYENETYGWFWREGMLTDIINITEFNGEHVFRNEDGAIFVTAYIPADKKSTIVTQEDIRNILAKYISLVSEEPATIDWLTIYE